MSTRVLKPQWAVLWAAFFNFIAFAFFGLNVATTIGIGLIDPNVVNESMIVSVLLAAILWNILTWYLGLPSSSSHALIGGLLGAALMKAGLSAFNWLGISKVILAIILSPLLGLLTGGILMLMMARIFFHSTPSRINTWFRRLQFLSAAFVSLAHGGNDAQKTMGIIAILLYSGHYLGDKFYVPFWIIVMCNFTIALGTFFGGWRIVKTMGMKITKLKPIGGFCAETASGLTLAFVTLLGIPVSTTHTITGAIIGVGSINRSHAVRWGIARNIIWAWILTIPAAAGFAAGIDFIINRL